MRNHLNVTYPNPWIGRGRPVPWPARSPDLTPLDYFLCGSMKSMVYGTPVTSEEDLIARIHGAIQSLTRQPHLIGHMCEAQHRRRRLCNHVGGTQFEFRLQCRFLDVGPTAHVWFISNKWNVHFDALQRPNCALLDRGYIKK